MEQAVSLVLDHYMDRLDSATLYRTAYDGTLTALRMAGGADDQGTRPTFSNDRQADAATFRAAFAALVAAHPSADQTMLAYAAIRAVVNGIDECHTIFFDPPAAHAAFDPTYAGIGMTVLDKTLPAKVAVLFPDSPAARSGLMVGDLLLAIDGVDVSAQHADVIAPLVRGPEGTAVTLTVRRPGEATPRTFAVTRARITPPVLTTQIRTTPSGAKIGYLKLYSFPQTGGVADEMRTALTIFEQAGATGWVLDLRDNPGGRIDTLSRIASLFLSGRQLGFTLQRVGQGTIATDAGATFDVHRPLAILINEGSSSASEILAAAMQDYGLARIFGTQSDGCVGEGQRYPLLDGSALEVTIATVLTPNRRVLNRVGVTPDEVFQPGPNAASDAIPDAVLDWLAAQP